MIRSRKHWSFSSPQLRYGLAFCSLLFGMGLSGCKGRSGSVCRCTSDCRSGFLCYGQGSELPCEDGKPTTSRAGECIEDEDAMGMNSGGGLETPPIYEDLPSRRDLGGSSVDSGDSETSSTSGSETSGSNSDEGSQSMDSGDTEGPGTEAGSGTDDSGDSGDTESSTGEDNGDTTESGSTTSDDETESTGASDGDGESESTSESGTNG